MIEVIHPGILSIVVDGGRNGYADYGVPSSSAIDLSALKILNTILKNPTFAPAIEVIGSGFSLLFHAHMTCAITGAKVETVHNGESFNTWTSFEVRRGDTLKIKNIIEGFRYYVGFSGIMDIEKTINSFSTNLECGFGGFKGRPLKKGDIIGIINPRIETSKTIPEDIIPNMKPPHMIHFVKGPEYSYFVPKILKILFEKNTLSCYKVSPKTNRTGIRLEGIPLLFKKGIEKSIISEGVLPGTIQIPGDGMPIIMLNERTIGGYARVGVVTRADRDLLAHLKPGDEVQLRLVNKNEAKRLSKRKNEIYWAYTKTMKEVSK